jgi:hypothetical protein
MSPIESRPESMDARENPLIESSRVGEADAHWRWLYRIGGLAAALLVVATIIHSSVYFVVGLPDDVVGWFGLFGDNPIGGLMAFELLMVVYVVLSVPVVLALYVAMRRASPSLMVVYLGLSLLGIVAFIAARPAFEMLSLSQGYAAATTEAQRSAYMAAGEATLAVFHGTAFWVSYLLGSIGGLIVAAVMLRSTIFSKTTAYLRIASSVLDFGLFVPVFGLSIALGSVLCLTVFNVLVARRLLQLGRDVPARSGGARPWSSARCRSADKHHPAPSNPP